MAEVTFIYEGVSTTIMCYIDEKIRNICNNFCEKTNTEINSLVFLFGGGILNIEKNFNEISKENNITILAYKDEEKIYSRFSKLVNDGEIDEIILLNNNINNTLIKINSQINNIINILKDKNNINDIFIINNSNIINDSDGINNIDDINTQLKDITIDVNKIKDDIKVINNKLRIINSNYKNNNMNEYIDEEEKNNLLNNEIICIYNKQKEEISLLHDYTESGWKENYQNYYIEGKNNINENNIDIYINDKKIEFNYKYKSEKKGEIRVRFKIKKLLTSTFCMFRYCSSLISIDLSIFNSSKVVNMGYMFGRCSSLKSIDLSSFNTSNAFNMAYMFGRCSSLKSIDLSSFNTKNVTNMAYIFCECSSLKSIDLSSFNTMNVTNMEGMFLGCSSLKSIDLTSFDLSNVKNMKLMFKECYSLKKENIKSNNSIDEVIGDLNEKQLWCIII